MKIAIVGSSRLDEHERFLAREFISKILDNAQPHDEIITGDALGVDELVRSFASEVNCMTVVNAKDKQWEGNNGYKHRNMEIARLADLVYSIATKKIKDKRCYHCDEQNHDRTGGCWTRRFAKDKLGKQGEVIIIG